MEIIMKQFHINNIRFRNKLLIVYFLSVFLPVLLTNVVFYNITTNNVRTQKMHDLSLALEQMAHEFRKNVDDAVGVSSLLYTDNRVYTLLDQRYETALQYILAYNDYFRNLSIYTPLYSTIKSFDLYTNNNTVLYVGGIYAIDKELKESEWYQSTEDKRRSHPVITRTPGDSGKLDTFSVIRELNNRSYNSTQKIIKTNLSLSTIEQIFNNVTFEGHVYLVNDKGEVEYTTNPTINWKERSYQIDSISKPSDSIILEQTYYINYLDNWKVIGVVSEGELLEEIRSSGKFIYFFSIGNLIVPSLIIIYLTSNLHIRLSRIVRHMRKVDDQGFKLIEDKEYLDEIGTLTSEFNRMSTRIKDLINDVYIADIQKKDLELQQQKAQLSALQSQINPHFLFNVLETIRMRSFMKREYETADIIQSMGRLLRNSYKWNKDWVTVQEEIKLIQSFLEIQSYRFGDKMTYEIDVDENAKDCIIPNMIFIPFVENASNHGIEPLKGKGQIKIKIDYTNDQLRFLIKDNGVGMTKEKYEEILLSLKEKDSIGENIGIKNVYYRLQLYYKDKFKFHINSPKGLGTTIEITIPFEKEGIKL